MDRIAKWPAKDRADLMRETAGMKKMTPEVVEKDFWVCWTLARLFDSPPMAKRILFKGGTSLSKVFGLIERFSEDVDLILDWREVTHDNPAAARSPNQQDTFNKAMLGKAHDYLRERFLPEVQGLVGDVCQAVIEQNPEIVKIKYPAAFPSEYLRPEIQLEVGPLASWLPNAVYDVRPYAAEALPEMFARPTCRVHAIKAERTFREKVTILHSEAHREEDNPQPSGYSRHYYDVYRMAQSRVKADAFGALDLLRAVVDFKIKFYRRKWAHYENAKPGSLKIVPPAHVMRSVEQDYEQMQFMIFGTRPTFGHMMNALSQLETEMNAL